eukprot:c10714_g1_i1.p1 GENE.c10714_g1_i1~~c10714_g1_i1.p1  ORF type:complete len:642 (+),score=156.63 c10714_g1_i1:1783-3708(+)
MNLRYPFVCFTSYTLAIVYLSADLFDFDYVTHTPNLATLIIYRDETNNAITTENAVVPTMVIPENIGQLSNTLIWWFSSFAFSGTIPSTVGQLNHLTVLYLRANNLTGSVPTQLGLLEDVMMLDIGGNALTGSIPSQLGLLRALTHLDMSYCDLEGSYPSELGSLSVLGKLELGHNPKLRGTIPLQIALLTTLTSLDLSQTHIGGSIAAQLAQLTRLQSLWLTATDHSGTLPTELFRLTNISLLYLSQNSLSGQLPSDIGKFSNLQTADLGYNQFSGTLPSQFGLLTNLTKCWLGNNRFSGTLPSQLMLLTQLTLLRIATNKFDSLLTTELAEFLANPPFVFECMNSGLLLPSCVEPSANLRYVSLVVVAVFSTLAAALAIVLFAFGIYVIKNLQHAVIRTSGPIFSVVILAGLCCLLATVPSIGISLMDVKKNIRLRACRAAVASGSFGLVAVMSCIAIRSYPIWKIFDNPKMQKIVLRPAFLMRGVVLSLVINGALLTPLLLQITVSNIDSNGSITSNHTNSVCVISTLNVVLFLNLTYLFVHAGAVLFMNVKIRNVPCEFNETTLVARATFNIFTFGMCMLIIGFVSPSNLVRFLAFALAILLCVNVVVALLFVPKLIKVWELQRKRITRDGSLSSLQ